MATYPVILYPKLIADFRKTHSLSLESDGNKAKIDSGSMVKSLTSETLSKIQCYPNLLTAPMNNKKLDRKLSIVLIVLGMGLVAIGFASAGNQMQVVAFLLGLMGFLRGLLIVVAPFLLRQENLRFFDCLSSILVAMKHSILIPRQQRWIKSASSGIESAIKPPTQALLTQYRYQNSEETDLKLYLSKLADTMRGKVLQPDGVTEAPIGASEEAFKGFLELFFPGRVYAQLRLSIPNWDGAYSTDFTISFPEIGIWIDCEIDEPYDYKTGKPTHCINSDCNRNTFFLKNNWIVVRFSEEQIVRYPKSCCKELAIVIQIVTGMGMYSQELVTVPTLMPTPMWTHRQAKKMAKAKYRDRYLNSVKFKI